MTTKVYVGVSGFSYPAWRGRFYPKDAKAEELLAHYSRRLGSVEVNSSFYAAPKTTVVEGWSAKTEEEFRFSFKAPQQVTHILKLGAKSAETADRFSKTLDVLGPRRGAVLFQLPPYMKQDLKLLEEFLSSTSGIKGRVFEFRHKSWLGDPTYRLLEGHGVGFCIADTEEMKPEFRQTGDLAYFRLRKESYDAKAIDDWAAKIARVARESGEGYVYLRHDETGENAILAQRLAERLQDIS